MGLHHIPTLGVHTHVHAHAHPCPWVLGGHSAILLFMGGHGWACVGMGAILLVMLQFLNTWAHFE